MENKSVIKSNRKNSKWEIWSYGIGSLGAGALIQAFGIRALDFYENEVLLDIALIGLAWVIYGIWNAINDPLLGYLMDKNTRFTKKWGKRFPWLVASMLPFSIFYILIFIPPSMEEIPLFLWFLLTISIFDSSFTIWGIAYSAILPDKFRLEEERNQAVNLKYLFSMFGLVLGLLVPPLFLEYGNRSTFIIAAVIVAVVALVPMIVGIPGVKDSKEMIEHAIKEEQSEAPKEPFVSAIKRYVTHKNAMVLLMGNLCKESFQVMVLASVPYFVRSVLKLDAINETILLAGVLATVVLTLPLIYRLIAKKGTKFVSILGGITCAIGLFPLLFVNDVYIALIPMSIIGFGLGCELVGMEIALTDVVDENVVIHKKRSEGILYGLNGFIIRFSLLIEVIVFWIVHTLTDYQEGSVDQPVEALWGIRIHFALIPMILMISLAIIIWRFYTLTPDQVAANKVKIADMNL